MKTYVTEQRIDKAVLWKDKKPLLGRLDIELTERCNSNCVHCYINLPQNDITAKNKELSTAQLKNILREAVSLGCLSARFTGGEPLLREDFEELYLFARRQGLRVLIFTNATLIDKHLAELFCRIPPLENIEITVYGMSENSYEAVTGRPGSFKAARKGIDLLLDHKIPFVVKGALLPASKSEIGEFEKWASAIPWMDREPSYSMFFSLRCRREEAKNERIRSFRVAPEEGLRVLTRRPEKYLKSMREFCSKFISVPGDKLFSCGSGLCGGCVDAYGLFQPCMMVRHPDCVYDLKGGSLEDALMNFFPRIREMKAYDPEYLRRCAKCFLKNLCEQCPGKSWMEHGTLDTPVEYLCEVAHAQAKFLGLVREGEKAWEAKGWKTRIKNFISA